MAHATTSRRLAGPDQPPSARPATALRPQCGASGPGRGETGPGGCAPPASRTRRRREAGTGLITEVLAPAPPPPLAPPPMQPRKESALMVLGARSAGAAALRCALQLVHAGRGCDGSCPRYSPGLWRAATRRRYLRRASEISEILGDLDCPTGLGRAATRRRGAARRDRPCRHG